MRNYKAKVDPLVMLFLVALVGIPAVTFLI